MARTWAATCYIVVSVARYVDPSGRVVSTARSFTRWPIRWPVDVSAELLVQIYGLQADPPSKATRWWVIAGANVAAVDCSHRRLPVARRYDGHPGGPAQVQLPAARVLFAAEQPAGRPGTGPRWRRRRSGPPWPARR